MYTSGDRRRQTVASCVHIGSDICFQCVTAIGPRCAELRVRDAEHNWRIVYRVDDDAVIVVVVLPKKTQRLPDEIVRQCRQRLRQYDEACRRAGEG